MTSCSCGIPREVHLDVGANGAALNSKNQPFLLNNLRQYGWSPIRCSSVGVKSPSHETIRNMFQRRNGKDTSSSSVAHDARLSYRAAESGGTEQMVEPKESLELELSKANRNRDSHSLQYNIIQSWGLSMSRIAHGVNGSLGLPQNIFLSRDGDDHALASSSSDNEECLDLLRVFFYHAVKHRKGSLGSSPHTDWGSWTVVWQDSVGGLETYCRQCKKWIPVPAPTPSGSVPSDTWECIVHVGDMTSLALGLVRETTSDSMLSGNSNASNCHDGAWPSPKHRVLSPSETERTSLVYFAYPPASCSIEQMQTSVKDWIPDSSRGFSLPLSEYYLLQNQSISSSQDPGGHKGASMMYEKIKGMVAREVIQEKWKQVQRDYDSN